jgi:hypothetical protein
MTNQAGDPWMLGQSKIGVDFGNIVEDDMSVYQIANSSNANSIYIPSVTNSPNTIITTPNTGGLGQGTIGNNPNWSWGSTSTNITLSQPTYAVLKLPRKKMPEKVFVQGLMKTCGILGTDAECAYTDRDMIIFSPGVVPYYDSSMIYMNLGMGINTPSKPTISLEYRDAVYHYVVDRVPVKGDSSTTLDVRQVGMVKKGK